MFAVLEARIGPQRPQKGLLEGILGGVGTEPAPQEAEDDVPLLDVEALERGDRCHGCHHSL